MQKVKGREVERGEVERWGATSARHAGLLGAEAICIFSCEATVVL